MGVLKERPAVKDRTLAGVKIFAGLGEADLREIADLCTWRSVPARKVFVHVGDTTQDVYFLISGRARVIIYGSSGRPVSFRGFGPGQCFGEFSAIDARPRSASVEATTVCTVAWMSSQAFMSILGRYPSVTLALLRDAIGQVRQLTDRIFEFSTLAVRTRIRAELLRLANDTATKTLQGQPMLSPAPKHAEMASRISTHREAVTKELNALAARGILERRRSAIVVLDPDALKRLVVDDGGS